MDVLLNSYVRWGAEERFSILLDSRLMGAQEVVLTSYSTPRINQMIHCKNMLVISGKQETYNQNHQLLHFF